jgi:hypothetical protein
LTLLFEATFLSPTGQESDEFRPSVKGYFADGREAESDNTGVGCGVRPLAGLGYESGVRRRIAKDEAVRVYVGAIYIPTADAGQLEYATLYGGDDTRMSFEIVLDATG